MNSYRKIVLCIAFVLSLCLMAGCSSKQAFSNTELKNIENCFSITIAAPRFASETKKPKDIETTLTKITPWLKEATQYNGKMPDNFKVSNGNPGYPNLNIKASGGRLITIFPAYYTDTDAKTQYIEDVLVYYSDNQVKGYIKSKELYDWLINYKYEDEFYSQGY